MGPPKSPSSEKHTSSQSKRPGLPRRSSSDKSFTKAPKHGIKTGQASQTSSKDQMPHTGSGPNSPVQSEHTDREAAQDRESDTHMVQDILPVTLHEPPSAAPEVSHTESASRQGGGNDVRSRKGGISSSTSQEEVDRLRNAMNAQLQLTQHREKLARQLVERDVRTNLVTTTGKPRVSPIHEEILSPSFEDSFASPPPSALETASTESVQTVKGGMTPGPSAVRTPSYPFPLMRTSRQYSYNGHRPFTALSPTVNPTNFAGGLFDSGVQDHLLSGSVTPASSLNFQPSAQFQSEEDPNFKSPNLYDLSLLLAAEPGLDPWWTTVVDLMREWYKAERVTLSVPADSTDIENVPWGQKATFNATEDDALSFHHLPRGSSFVQSSRGTNDISNMEIGEADEWPSTPLPLLNATRPGISSRHSFTTYEDTKCNPPVPPETSRTAGGRPIPLTRAKSHLSAHVDLPPRAGTLHKAKLNLQSLQDHMEFEKSKLSAEWEDTENANQQSRGRVFSVLQALDYEADPLIDSSGVLRVLDRGNVIALTRDYPYVESLESDKEERSSGSISGQLSSRLDNPSNDNSKTGKSPGLSSRISSFLGGSRRPSKSVRSQTSDKGKSLPAASSARMQEDNEQRPPTPRYEEYEQAPPSPWAQSPAPSPAVRAETEENPFFATDNPIDKGTFDPKQPSLDYSSMPQVEAIGIDRSWTVLHIPLIHPLLSKPVHSFRLDAAAIESKSKDKINERALQNTVTGKPQATESDREKRIPIAILSILSPVIPYPSNLRHSLANLAPHLATSFSLCRHYSNLETELAGLSRKRPQTAGFGPIAVRGRPTEDSVPFGNLSYSPADENGPHISTGGSITSPSDYSGFSRSAANSPAGTPAWDPISTGFNRDKRSSTSPGQSTGESYFNPRTRPGFGRADPASSITGAMQSSNQTSPAEYRSQPPRTSDEGFQDGPLEKEGRNETGTGKTNLSEDWSSNTTPKQEPRARQDLRTREANFETKESRDISSTLQQTESALSPRRQALRAASNQGPSKPDRQHTQLHTYGADYGATFQSLSTTSTPDPTVIKKRTHSRSGSGSSPPTSLNHMLPPSDRLKGLMLDSLPAHVFVALPATGEIVWVNNRYLNYRGQTVPELYQDPYGTIHPHERDDYVKAWSHAIRTGEQFSMQVRIRRFDGSYRWFYTRAVGHRDIRGVIVQWYGSHMDIHDQHIAEVKAARQEEIEASEAKHRQLANLIPQIIFAATEDEGVTFANDRWLSYTGQDFDQALGLGFMDFVHPEDLARCQIPVDRLTPRHTTPNKAPEPRRNPSQSSSAGKSSNWSTIIPGTPTDATAKPSVKLSRNNSSSSISFSDIPNADLSELARAGVVKITIDSDGRKSYTTEVRLRSKSGEYRWHLVRCVEVDNISLGSGDGSWFGACTDINDHKLLEAKLKEAMESKSKFLSNMSHEIRTPLIGISGMVAFLQDTPLNDEQIDYASTIQSSAGSLLNIINDILDLSKVDAGMMKLTYEWFHTRSLVEEVNEMVCTMAITKRLELNYVIDVDVPEMVKGDKFRIRQVLLNVIGNAIKFTTIGEVFSRCKVIVGAEGLDENEVMLEYSVVDTGRGFTKEDADLMFKPFSQIDGSSTRQHGGSGLGLVISRQLVELHGGKMEGFAVLGEGSTFVFTAKFGLPTVEDHPEPTMTPSYMPTPAEPSTESPAVRALKQAGGNPILANKLMQSPLPDSPKTDSSANSPGMISSGGSDPSIRSLHSTHRSSTSSIAQSLAHFGDAARAGGADLAAMKLALPERISPTTMSSAITHATFSTESSLTPTGEIPPHGRRESGSLFPDSKRFRPPMYSILLVCPQTHSREATTQHIEMTLPKDVPHQITPLSNISDAQEMIGGEDPVRFTHIVLNVGEAKEIVALIEQIVTASPLSQASIVVLSDPVQRQEVIKMAAAYKDEQLSKDNRVTFIYKPVKPSRFAVIFDPDKEQNLSTDRNRSNAQQQVANQKQNYLDVGKRLGNKGHRVLLVEDNLVNQKVLLKFLSKIGITVELALDGVECIEKLFAHPHSFYSLILCDLHMPRKDGYQTCREIRQWEKKESLPRMPIIALSANVMADVLEKCVQAGFSNYVTKPVDFKALSTAMSDLLDPAKPVVSAPLLE